MAVAAGEKFGPYQVEAHVGEGGMGEVYRARDTRLNRSVAVKVLPEAMVSDAGRMHRFEQEARTVAALNHPNILQVYDVGVQNGTPYLVMELLEGETLRERLNRGLLGVRKSVEIGLQIAHGLAAAHERGIVHRDLKPENIFLTRDGHTKLLDFGLAKAAITVATAAGASGQLSDFTAQTVQTMATQPGVVMGTAPYMAPEQVRGEPVDHRADIFSFGAVLYEMISGQQAFHGDSAVEVMNAVLKAEPPDIDAACVKVPPALDRIIRHCLEKSPDDRFQSARDLTFALGALSGSDSTGALQAQTTKRREVPRWLLGVATVLLIAAAATAVFFATRKTPAPPMEFAIPVNSEVTHIAISPDGTMLAYVAIEENTGEGVIYIQEVGTPAATRLSGTEGATYPFWSPDDNYVGFFANNKLKKVYAYGGSPQALAPVQDPRGGTWGAKNVIVYSPDSGGPLWRVDADGTDAAPLTDKNFVQPGVSSHRWPVFLPDGNHFLFWAGDFADAPDDKVSGIYISSLSDPGNKKLITLAASSPGYSRGHLFYVDQKGALLAVPMDVSGNVSGKALTVAAQVGRHPSTYWGAFSVALNGTVIFHEGSGASLSQLVWYDRSGKELGRVGTPGLLANPNLSPDGRRVSFDLADPKGKNIDVYLYDLERNAGTRFTFDPAEETTAAWSRDGKTIAFRSADGPQNLRLKNSNGFETDRLVPTDSQGEDLMPNSFDPFDSQLVVTGLMNEGGSGLLQLHLSDGKGKPLLAGRGNQSDGQISPDGKWIAYESDESGEWEVYISPFPNGGGKLQVSQGGGTEPRWRGDGKEIFYLDFKRNLVAVPVSSEGSLSTGTPTILFQSHARSSVSSSDLFSYDVTPDGKRFLIDRYIKPVTTPPLSIILNSTNARP